MFPRVKNKMAGLASQASFVTKNRYLVALNAYLFINLLFWVGRSGGYFFSCILSLEGNHNIFLFPPLSINQRPVFCYYWHIKSTHIKTNISSVCYLCCLKI